MQTSSVVRRFALAALFAGFAAIIAVACGDSTGPGDDDPPSDGDPAVATVEISPDSATLTAIGAETTFEATALDSAGSEVADATISWSSSAPAVATVDGSGTVTAAGDGEATITAESEGESATATVTVDQEVSQVGLTPSEASMVVGDTVQFSAEATDANGNAVGDASVTFSSTDTTVLAVDGSGRAVGRAEGSAEVVAAAGPAADTASVSVRPAASSVDVTPDSARLTALGDTQRYEAAALDAAGDTIAGVEATWSSSDTAVAGVDDTGLATARGSGTATITAAVDDASGSALLVVDQEVATVEVTPDTASVAVDDTTRLAAEASDANGNGVADAGFAWSSTDTDVATVDGTGLVTGESDGSAMIVGESGGVADSSVVNVTRTVASVAVTPDSAGATALGETADFGAAALDGAGDTIPGVSFTWSSSDTAVATVDGSGVATARGNGSATISASTGDVTGSAVFTVDQEVASVAVSPDSAGVAVGDTTSFAAEASDANGNGVADAGFAWSSTDTDVATVDSTGLVTGQSQGSAQVIASSSGQADSAVVTVEEQSAGTISAVSGGGQEDGVTTRAFGDPLVVEVTDGGEPVSGVTVTWSVASGAASLSMDSTTTDSDGRASVEVTAGESTGPITVEAAAEGSDGSPVAFELETNTALFLVGDIYFEDPGGDQNTNASVTITLGQDVLWEWVGSLQHNVQSGEGSGGSGGDGVPSGGQELDSQLQSSGTYSFTPSAAGTWEFYCEAHPSQMYGATIVVEQGGSSDAVAAGPSAADLEPGDVVRPEGSHFVFIYRGPPGEGE